MNEGAVVAPKNRSFSDIAKEFVGQPVAILAARYQYRGILTEANSDCIVLAKARAVERSGKSDQDAPTTEDKINGSVCIKNDAVEILYQPRWCMASLDD